MPINQKIGKDYKFLRALWFLLTIFCWAGFIYMLTHRSSANEILDRYSVKYFSLVCIAFLATCTVTILNYKKFFYRIYTIRNVLLLTLFSLIITISFMEFLVRVIDLQGISYYSELTRYDLDKLPDKNLIYKHRPLWKAKYQGVECRFNEFGLRDEPIMPKMRDEIRILVLGDSVVFGWGVPQEKVFSYRLQAIHGENRDAPIRVINSGVGSYNTTQELFFLKIQGLEFKPDAIILIYVPNDVTIHPPNFDPKRQLSIDGKSPPQILQMLLAKSWLWRLGWHHYQHGAFAIQKKNIPVFNPFSPGVLNSMKSVKEILSICETNNIPIHIFYFNWHLSHNDPLFNHLKQTVYPKRITHMGEWFKDKNIFDYTNTVVDSHPNADAHQVIAENIYHILEDQGLLYFKSKYN